MLVAAMASTSSAKAQCQLGWLSGSAVQHSNPNIAYNSMVHALVVLPNGDLVAGGQFDSIGGVAANNIARWDGSAWHPLGAGIQQIPAGACTSCYPVPVQALAVLQNGDLVAGGAFTIAGTAGAANLARWDGQAWSQYGGGRSTSVTELATHPNGNLIAVVDPQVMQFDGTSWSTLGTATGAPGNWVNAMTVLPGGAVVVAGRFSSIGGTSTPSGIAIWNGSTWSHPSMNIALGEVSSLAVLASGHLVAGRKATNNMWIPPYPVQEWDGVAWSSIGTPTLTGTPPLSSVKAMTVLDDGRLVVAGNFNTVSSVPTPGGFAVWDGANWSSMGGGGGPFGAGIEALTAALHGTFFAGGLASVDRWGCRASGTRFGAGCYTMPDTFYEEFPTPPANFDLSQSTLHMDWTPTGYSVTRTVGAPAFVQPISSDLMLGDDSVTGPIQLPFPIPYPGGSSNQIVIGSNGFVYLEPDALAWPFGYVSDLLSRAPRHAALWGDLDPATGTGAGTVHYDIDPTNQTVFVTWLGIAEWNTPSAISTFQIAMSANGAVEYRYQNCAISARPALTGWSPGYGAADRGGLDLSATGPFSTWNPPGVAPLEHDATSLPILGAVTTVTTTNIPVGASFGTTVLSWTRHDPGIDLAGFGMPGCRQHVGMDLVAAFLPASGTANHSFAVPTMTALLGAHVYTQGIVFTPGVNALGALTSNGVDLQFGW